MTSNRHTPHNQLMTIFQAYIGQMVEIKQLQGNVLCPTKTEALMTKTARLQKQHNFNNTQQQNFV